MRRACVAIWRFDSRDSPGVGFEICLADLYRRAERGLLPDSLNHNPRKANAVLADGGEDKGRAGYFPRPGFGLGRGRHWGRTTAASPKAGNVSPARVGGGTRRRVC
jgi:hypothetical protein